MIEPVGSVPVRLTCAEGHAILVLIQSGSFLHRPASVSAADKLRLALVATGFDPDVDVHIDCTKEEARFLERCRGA